MDQLLALRTFVRIAEAGSFAKAAHSLALPRSTVSKLLQDLEAHLGTKLVERTTRAVTMTREGEAYRERALRLLADLDDMDAAAGPRTAPKGRLRVDIGSVIAGQILIPSLSDFRQKYPEVELFLGVSDRHVDLVADGVDCVIRGGSLGDTSLVARRLCELDYVACAAPGFLDGRDPPGHPADIDASRDIVSYFSAATGKRFPLRFARGDEQIEIEATGGVSVNESTAHLECLLAGLGMGQTFGFMARPRVAAGTLVELLPEWKPRNQVLHLVHPASRFPNPRLRAFSDWTASLFAAYDARRHPAAKPGNHP